MLKKIFLFVVLSFFVINIFAADGYDFKIKIKGYEEKELLLAYHLGDKQYIRDTVEVDAKGFFQFKGEEAMDCGVYLVVLKPDNKFFQLLINDQEQRFTLTTDMDDLVGHAKIEGSEENSMFFKYLNFLNERSPKAEALNKEKEAATDDAAKNKIQQKLDDLNKEVESYQLNVLEKHAGTLTAQIIQSTLRVDMPEFEGTDEEVQVKQWRYMQKHYFDNLDLANPCMLRTPFLFQRVDYFVNKLQVQHPDTIFKAIEQVLDAMEPAPETFKFYVIHFLNEFATSKIVGMDAVYVDLAEKYYATGKAPWVDEEQLAKILENVKDLKPTLIGKTAPDLLLEKRSGGMVKLSEIESEYTILYFWRYDCGHCKKSSPFMKDFYDKYKDKGVKIVAVCTKSKDEIPECWKYVDENEIQDWIHTYDPYFRSMKLYNIKSTPQIFVLDRNKEIITKRIGAEQLEEVMDKIIEMNKEESEEK
ncbi:MAG: redoxin domain-containing protein [Saprospiraceae bacterium]|nr:redoxin domain-containing protein [Saprospiraceae bacterium]MCB9323055.1 redoxin domain-containing protein [Lewinellaceae bacterium]